MRLTTEAVEDFKRIWTQEYGMNLTDEQAQEYAERLIGFFETLLSIDKRSRRNIRDGASTDAC